MHIYWTEEYFTMKLNTWKLNFSLTKPFNCVEVLFQVSHNTSEKEMYVAYN